MLFYFVGIVLDETASQGIWEPDYILTIGTQKRFDYQFSYTRSSHAMAPRILLNDLLISDDILNLAAYFIPGTHNDMRKVVQGWLCLYECDEYGVQKGVAFLIAHVPTIARGEVETLKQKKKRKDWPTLLTEDRTVMPLKESTIIKAY